MVRRTGRIAAFATLVVCLLATRLPAQSSDDGENRPAKPLSSKGGGSLADEQEQIAKKFKHLEEVLIRLSEQTAGIDRRRADVLRKAAAQSKDREIAAHLDELVKVLQGETLAPAINRQKSVQQDLVKLLDLLLSEDRSKRLASEKDRIREYIKQLNKIINREKLNRAEAAGDGDPKQTAERQGQIADETGGLAQKIAQAEGNSETKPGGKGEAKPDEKNDGKAEGKGDGKGNGKGKSKGEGKPAEKGEGKSKGDGKAEGKGEGKSEEKEDGKAEGKNHAKPNEKADGKTEPKGDGKGKPDGKNDGKGDGKSEKKEDRKADDKTEPKGDGKGKPDGKSDGKGEGKGEGKAKGKAQGKGQGQGEPQDGDEEEQEEDAIQPGDNPAQKRIEQAEQKMREARRKLEEAKRGDATKKQDKAIEKLQQAVAELEEILRQLREEETARMLAMLEARFRKMLEMQIDVYERTKLLDKTAKADHELVETDIGPLKQKEAILVVEADKALALLKAEGSAVAFPEAVTGIRDDMEQVKTLLSEIKVGEVTQGIEEDIISALEEMIAALEKAQKDLEAKKMQPPPPGGEPVDPPLVDTLAELKMIRALQMRVNRRTQHFKELVKTETVDTADLLKSLEALADREERIYRVTREIVAGRNQ